MLRGIAAICVVYYHMAGQQIQAIGPNPVKDLWVLAGPWNQGYAGVDLFFVISGFIMVYVTRNTGRSLSDVGQFLYKRVVRIYPLWWVFASIMGLYYFLAHGMWGAPSLQGLTAPAIGYFVKSLLLIPQNIFPVLGLGWSLIHEMQFYIIFATFLLAPRRWLPFLLAVWATANFVGHFAFWDDGNPAVKLVFSLLSLEFIAGGFTAMLILKGIVFKPKWAVMIGGACVVAALWFYTDKSLSMSSWGRVAVFTVPFALVTYGLVTLENLGVFTPARWLEVLGDWSYSLYLSHYLVFIGIRRIGREAAPYLPEGIVSTFTLGAPGAADNIAFILAASLLSILTAGLCYRFIEQPLLRLAKRGK